MMELTVRHSLHSIPVVELKGEWDTEIAPAFRITMDDLIDQGNRHVVVDLSHIQKLDGTGITQILSALKWIRERNGNMSLIASTSPVDRVLKLARLDRILTIFGSEQQAMEEIPGK